MHKNVIDYGECVGCSTPSYPCLGNCCPMIRVTRWWCDECGREIVSEDDLKFDDVYRELCKDCYEELYLSGEEDDEN